MSEATKADLLGKEALETAQRNIPDWRVTPGGDAIEAIFLFPDFVRAFAFMTEIAKAAEEQQHHPEWKNVWNRVELRLTTHSAGGLTDKDIRLAKLVDRAAGKHQGRIVEPGEADNCPVCVA